MAKKKRGRAPHSGDTRGGAFAGIPLCVIKSEAYHDLDVFARAVLVELVARMNGYNNGQITISYKELAVRLNRKNEAKIGQAIASLVMHGLLEVSAESIWQERRAREYRLTFVNTTDAIGRPIKATNDYLSWSYAKPPEASVVRKCDTTTVVADTAHSDTAALVAGYRESATAPVVVHAQPATAVVAAPRGKDALLEVDPATTEVAPIDNPYPSHAHDQKEAQPFMRKVPGTKDHFVFVFE